MANTERGEVDIELDGKKYTMRPTFEALCNIEDQVGMGIPELIMRLSAGDVRLKYIVPVIHAGITAFNKEEGIKPSPEYGELGAIVMKSGFRDSVMASPVKSPIAEFLLRGINGGRIVEPGGGDEPGKKEATEA